ncbi:hypothetical protein [Prosthecobacter fluviatilis]|uniref:VanZ like family protein n=1 Tax=Prosthecobacter fluviatilis TaxID=445931 RepID=A0ABW0KQ42_9BACT
MKPLPSLLLRAGWAPLVVLIFHHEIQHTSWRQRLDFLMHYSGGVAIGFFLWHALDCFAHWLGSLTPFARYLFTFALACTVGLFWEFAELFSDVFFHTRIQFSVRETMRDLIADATGAATTLTLTWLVRCCRKK